MRFVVAALIASGFAAQAQTGLHACQADPADRKIYNQVRTSPDRVKLLREALAEHPDDLFLNYWLIVSPDERPGPFAAEYKTRLDAHPGEPVFQYLYGRSLLGKDTPQALRLIEGALAKDPEIPYAYETLMEIYASSGFRDRAKLVEDLRALYGSMPRR